MVLILREHKNLLRINLIFKDIRNLTEKGEIRENKLSSSRDNKIITVIY
jgi:hypothetical protein